MRFLATVESQQSLSFSYRIGKSTASKIVSETCDVIYNVLSNEYLRPRKSKEEWLRIARDFEERWNMPHTIGAIDDKHIRIQCPAESGTLFHNYKGFFSLVLMAICDANYCFTLIDVGDYGSNNDSGVLSRSKMGCRFEAGKIYPGHDIKLLLGVDGTPSVLVGIYLGEGSL